MVNKIIVIKETCSLKMIRDFLCCVILCVCGERGLLLFFKLSLFPLSHLIHVIHVIHVIHIIHVIEISKVNVAISY